MSSAAAPYSWPANLHIADLFSKSFLRENHLYVLAALPVLWYLWKAIDYIRNPLRRYPQFPGPKGLPILGNVLQIQEKQWLKYTDWHKEFGPIYSLNFVGQPVVVIGSAKIAADLMERRSNIYSDRPRFIMATEVLTGGMNLAFARWGDRWKRMRKAANGGLSVKAALSYTPLQEKEAIYFLDNLLNDKGNDKNHLDLQIRRTAAATVLSAVYAYPPIKLSDPVVVKVENYVERMLKAALPGNYLVDFFPAMMYIPTWLAKWKRDGYEWFRRDTQMFLGLMGEVQTGLKNGTRGDCFVASLLENTSGHDLNQVESAWLAGMMFGAGSEALAATFGYFVLAMVLHPNVQAKLRAEIDSIVGSSRLPTFNDTRQMPYLQACIKETMRWRPMGPLAVPHRSTQDDVYEDHFIPAGTLIFPNVWAMHRDESVYPNPEEYYPERFLEADGKTPVMIPETKELGQHAFGFGRRSCIGYSIANNALVMDAASLIWAFYIKKAKDANGNEITPDKDAVIDEGLAVRPAPFDCIIEPRSASIVEMIKAARAQV